jgi:hypothetical protein
VNLACQAASQPAHILPIVISDAGSVLVHAHKGSIDYLHRRVMTGGQIDSARGALEPIQEVEIQEQ